MRPYAAILSARFRLLLQYRAAAFGGLVTQVFWGMIRMMIFWAFYEHAASPPVSEQQTVAYVWLGQAFLLLTMLGIDPDVSTLIRSGNVVYEMTRPVDLYALWFSRMLAQRIAPTMLRAVPILVFATAMGWIRWPAWGVLPAFMASLGGAVLLSAAFGVLLNVTMFWTVSGVGVSRLIWATAYIFGGTMMPLPLFPDSWQFVLAVLPFRGLGDVPYRLFIGNIPPGDLGGLLLHQLAWTAALVLAGRLLLRRAARRLVVQGG